MIFAILAGNHGLVSRHCMREYRASHRRVTAYFVSPLLSFYPYMLTKKYMKLAFNYVCYIYFCLHPYLMQRQLAIYKTCQGRWPQRSDPALPA